MTRAQSISLAILAAVVLLIVVLALRNPRPSPMPPDADHAVFHGHEACLECHGPAGESPQSANHPLGQDCLQCHTRQK